MARSKFAEYVQEEIQRYKGIAMPIKAGFLERHFVRKLPPKKLHPNPDDEFTDPAIGPNDEIIAKYVYTIQEARYHSISTEIEEPLTVEKMTPDGYMLLNGHHRWAAAIRMNMKRVPVEIVNLTMLSDVEKMLKTTSNTRRVTLDLDEVVFATQDGAKEKALPFPLNIFYKERLRMGVPALFSFLHKKGYDVWVYSSACLSMDHVRGLLRAHRTRADGIITGNGRGARSAEEKKQWESMIANKYTTTIHLDRDSMVISNGASGEYQDYSLSGQDETWSREVMDKIGELNRK